MSNLPDPVTELPQALDIQHDSDPASDHGPARRIPHLGHALLFFSLVFMCINICTAVSFVALRIAIGNMMLHPGVMMVAQGFGYVMALLVSFQLFPRLWRRSFLHGIQWNVLAAHRRWFWIVPLAIATSLLAQYADHFVKMPEESLITKLMQTVHGAWMVTGFGVLIAPVTEEIAFRGFLLPALATAYDWLALERSPAGLRTWEMTSGHSTEQLLSELCFRASLSPSSTPGSFRMRGARLACCSPSACCCPWCGFVLTQWPVLH